MATIARDNVIVGAEVGGFVKPLKDAEKSTLSLGSAISSMGKGAALGFAALGAAAIAGVAGISALWVSTAASIDGIGDAAGQIGITTEALGALGYAAALSGSSQETLNGALLKMSNNLGEAAINGGGTAKSLESLGLSVNDLMGQSPDQQILSIGKSIAEIEDPALKAKYAIDIFGKSGAELIPLFDSGGEAINGMMQEAVALNVALDNTEVAKVQAANDAIDKVKMAIGGVANTLTVELAPYVTALADQLFKMGFEGGKASDFILKGIQMVVGGIGYAVDIFNGLQGTLKILQGSAMAVFGAITIGVGNMISSLNDGLDLLGLAPDGMKEVAADINAVGESLMEGANEKITEGADQIAGAFAGEGKAKADKFFNDLQNGANAAADKIAKTTGEAEKMKQAMDALEKKGKLDEAVNKTADDLQKQIATFDKTDGEKAAYDLEKQGASEEQINQVKKLHDELDKLEKAKEAAKEKDKAEKDHQKEVSKFKKEEAKDAADKRKEDFLKQFEKPDVTQTASTTLEAGSANALKQLQANAKENRDKTAERQIEIAKNSFDVQEKALAALNVIGNKIGAAFGGSGEVTGFA